MAYCFVQGNTRPYFAIRVRQSQDNSVVDLTNTTVAFYFRHQHNTDPNTAEVNGSACNVTDATGGKVEYRWGANDLNKPGLYTAEFRITFVADSTTQSILIDNVEVQRRLG